MITRNRKLRAPKSSRGTRATAATGRDRDGWGLRRRLRLVRVRWCTVFLGSNSRNQPRGAKRLKRQGPEQPVLTWMDEKWWRRRELKARISCEFLNDFALLLQFVRVLVRPPDDVFVPGGFPRAFHSARRAFMTSIRAARAAGFIARRPFAVAARSPSSFRSNPPLDVSRPFHTSTSLPDAGK